jgi:hypothetical protein
MQKVYGAWQQQKRSIVIDLQGKNWKATSIPERRRSPVETRKFW